jgi:hypothetical protein
VALAEGGSLPYTSQRVAGRVSRTVTQMARQLHVYAAGGRCQLLLAGALACHRHGAAAAAAGQESASCVNFSQTAPESRSE